MCDRRRVTTNQYASSRSIFAHISEYMYLPTYIAEKYLRKRRKKNSRIDYAVVFLITRRGVINIDIKYNIYG